MRRQAASAAGLAVVYGAGVWLTAGSVHAAVGYGLALLTGVLFGLGLARLAGRRGHGIAQARKYAQTDPASQAIAGPWMISANSSAAMNMHTAATRHSSRNAHHGDRYA